MINIEKNYYDLLQKISSYEEAVGLMYWDLRTGAPKKAVDQRSQAIGVLSTEIFQLKTSEEMNTYICELLNDEVKGQLSEKTLRSLAESKKEYDLFSKIPADEYKEYVILQSKAESVWEEAKDKSDYQLFAPYLKNIVEYTKKFIGYWGYNGNKYNTLLDQYEPGITVDVLDRVFGQLREYIVPLVKEISESPYQPKTDFLFKPFPKENQKLLSEFFLKEIGYDFEAGRLDETVHPFATTLNQGDVRVTTKYDETDFRTAIFGTIHECGHAVYEQNISEDLAGTNLSGGASMGIHESQSLFHENFIGRNYGFWKRYYSKLIDYSPEQFEEVSLDEFFEAINESKPSLIRIEADELTYPLHIMIRYEIEKALFNDELTVEELPEVWNQKYEEYLGITPPNDAKGVLQDVHWSGGSFGYFPSYALGYMYAAQLKQTILKDLPNYDELIENGHFSVIKEWLTKNIHQYGKMKQPLEILQDVTGEGLNVQYLINYLDEKYRALYKL
ncbi:carboxypeptidase M32 [Metabacillus arenae]|uniref:Metal-dependent carboxypeptidase n=1 Tax=Metabacillus arenae TaxID=2771434 RepID=A0A926NJ01_9BACI|nr:carboxypeptidase M32 [Metabacillus arenae]MBD1381645.1 carboxypeptidase M32 [Metabacillus arenae]